MLEIDGDSLVYRIGFSAQSTCLFTGENVLQPFDIVQQRIKYTLNKIYRAVRPTVSHIYIDGGENFRHNIATILPYKANRDISKRPFYYDAIRDYLQEAYYATVVKNHEVDDELGIGAYYKHREYEYTICGEDKDLKQLATNHYNWVKDEHVSVTELDALRFFYYQIITGDKQCDNVPGLFHCVSKLISPQLANKVRASQHCRRAKKMLLDAQTEDAMYDYVACEYLRWGLTLDHLLEIGRLLWIRRKPDQIWKSEI